MRIKRFVYAMSGKNLSGDKYTNLIDGIESIYTSVNPNNKIIESGSIKMKSEYKI